MPRAIEIDDLTVTFGATVALDAVTLTVEAGEAVALIGPNGCGKTTLLHAIAGLHRPARGRVRVIGGRRRLAYVTQRRHHTTFLPLTAGEVLATGCYRERGLVRPLRRTDRHRIAAAAERLDVAALLGRQFGELSGGQQQRVLVAQALVQDPQVLLLDEPITGLDLPSQARILEIVDEERARGTAIVLSTHHLDEARHCDRVALLAGRLVSIGPPDEVLTPEPLREAYGARMLGEHRGHAHDHDLLLLDDHGHGTH